MQLTNKKCQSKYPGDATKKCHLGCPDWIVIDDNAKNTKMYL